MSRLKRAGRIIWKVPISFLRVLIVVGCTAFSGLIGGEIISRYFFGMPHTYAEEIAVYGIVWIYMVGSIYGTYDRSHLMGGIVHIVFKSARVIGSFKVVTVSISLGLCCVMSVWGYQTFMWDLKTTPETDFIYLPLEYARLSLFVGFGMMAIFFLTELIDVARALLRHSTSDTFRGR